VGLKYLKNLIFCLVVFCVGTIVPVYGFTPGEHTALVIIDMQPVFISRGGHAEDSENQEKVQSVLRAQIKSIKRAEAAHIPIIFIEYEGEGETTDALKNEIKTYENVAFFKKSEDGMFDNNNSHKPELVKYLANRNIQTLIITGANGGAWGMKVSPGLCRIISV